MSAPESKGQKGPKLGTFDPFCSNVLRFSLLLREIRNFRLKLCGLVVLVFLVSSLYALGLVPLNIDGLAFASAVGVGAVPWNPRTNCESAENEENKPSNVDLAYKYSGNLKMDGIHIGNGAVDVPEMSEVVEKWESYIREAEDTVAVLESEDEEQYYIDQMHRFDSNYTLKQYRRIMDAQRHYSDNHGSNWGAAMITLTASNTNNNGQLRPYLDHMEDLKNGYTRARNRLNKVLDDGREWDYVAIMEPHKSGYAHIHLAVLFEGTDLKTQDFKPVVDSHLKNCEGASVTAHNVVNQSDYEYLKHLNSESRESEERDLGCVSVEYQDGDKAGIGAYVGAYLSKELNRSNSVLEAEDYLKRFYAALWVSGTQRYMTSQGLKQKTEAKYLQTEDFEDLSIKHKINKVMLESTGETVNFDSLEVSISNLKFTVEHNIEDDELKREMLGYIERLDTDWEFLGISFKSQLPENWRSEGIEEDDIRFCDPENSRGSNTIALGDEWEHW